MSGRLLLVEDDALLASSLSRALAANGYTVAVSRTVAEALAAVDESVPDLVLLDLGLPDGDGDEVCEHMVRNHPHVPVMVVTARTDEIDVVAGLTRGAVDYVAKPFRLAELLARVRSHLRMARAAAAEGDRPAARDTLVIGDLTIDRAARRVHVGDEELGLRPKEFDVLDLPRPPRRHGGDARAADRRRVGRELVGVDEDPRRAHQQHPTQARRAVG